MSIFKNNHANQRYFERVHPDTASKKDIIKAIQDPNNIRYIKRLTESRSMAYVYLPKDNIVKVIMNKNKGEIVTILPWKAMYSIVMHFDMKNGDIYTVDFFPDCFAETKNASTMNTITLTKANGEKENISFSHNDFAGIIQIAWEQYQQNQTRIIFDEVDDDPFNPEEETETVTVEIVIDCNKDNK